MKTKVATFTIIVRKENDDYFTDNEITNFEDKLIDLAEGRGCYVSSIKES